MLFGVNTLGGPWNIVLDVGPDPHREGGAQFKILGPPPVCGMAAARDLKFRVHIDGWWPLKNYAQVGHRGSRAESRDNSEFWDPLVSLEWLKLES